jgi:hypothetical protein
VNIEYEREIGAAASTSEKKKVELKWQRTFQGGKERKTPENQSRMAKAATKSIDFVKNIVKKPLKTMDMLGSIFQSFSIDSQTWRQQVRYERRSRSFADLSQKTENPASMKRFGSVANMSTGKPTFSAMVRLKQAKQQSDGSSEAYNKILQKPIDEMDEMELQEGIESEEDVFYDESFGPQALMINTEVQQSERDPDLDEKEQISMSSQVSEDEMQKMKVVKGANGDPKKIGQKKTQLESWLASNVPVGTKRVHDQLQQ